MQTKVEGHRSKVKIIRGGQPEADGQSTDKGTLGNVSRRGSRVPLKLLGNQAGLPGNHGDAEKREKTILTRDSVKILRKTVFERDFSGF